MAEFAIEDVINWMVENIDKSFDLLSPEEQMNEIRLRLIKIGITCYSGNPEEDRIGIEREDFEKLLEKGKRSKTLIFKKNAITDEIISSSRPFEDANLFNLQEKYDGEDGSDEVFVVKPNGRIALTADALRACLLKIVSGEPNNSDKTNNQHEQAQ